MFIGGVGDGVVDGWCDGVEYCFGDFFGCWFVVG